jgi:predicted MFS family arabinose efflux permease
VISRGLVLRLGASQLICWGLSYYLIGVFAHLIADDLGWPLTWVHGGFSAGLVASGAVSARVGRWIDRNGGRAVMVTGSILLAVGCAGIAVSRHLATYYLAWLCLGVAMRMTLYDAAFAALARIGGANARRPIAQITLLGGLASTTFWPIGQFLGDLLGWRGALLAYSLFALLTVPLHAAIPSGSALPAPVRSPAGTAQPSSLSFAALLYAAITAVTTVLNSGLSAHVIGMLAGLGMTTAAAVWVSSLRGIGQSAARLVEVTMLGRLSPLVLALLATGLLPLSLLLAPFSGDSLAAAIAFSLLFGAGNGLVTIVRGTLPLMLFDPAHYGAIVGRLLGPSFYLGALAPFAYALVIERFGHEAAFHLTTALAALAFASAVVLSLRREIRR